MHTEIITDVARATLAGTIAFPEVVRRLIETGVEYYHVDYVALRKTFYSAADDGGRGAGVRRLSARAARDLLLPRRRPAHRMVPRRAPVAQASPLVQMKPR